LVLVTTREIRMVRFLNAIAEGLIFGFTFAVGWIAAALLFGAVLV